MVVVSKLAEIDCFDLAISTAQSLDVDMTDIFELLTVQCLRLARNPAIVV